MKSFIDREKATEDINTLLREKTAPWMVLSGGRKIGKTEFAKKIANMNDNFIFVTRDLRQCTRAHLYNH